jgi:hypothetical protein
MWYSAEPCNTHNSDTACQIHYNQFCYVWLRNDKHLNHFYLSESHKQRLDHELNTLQKVKKKELQFN